MAYDMCVTASREQIRHLETAIQNLTSLSSIPFFFEPNFDARIEPLPTARRMQEEDRALRKLRGPEKTYEPVVYGDFLLRKVGSNFDTGKGRYDAE